MGNVKTSKSFYRALISATSKKEAFKILDALTIQRLVAGGLATSGESQYWWAGNRVKKIYWNLSVFTIASNRKKIISLVRTIQRDQVPIIAFFKIDDANADFLKWIHDNTSFR